MVQRSRTTHLTIGLLAAVALSAGLLAAPADAATPSKVKASSRWTASRSPVRR